MPSQPGPALAIALIILLALTLAVSLAADLRSDQRWVGRQQAVAALRAVLQLGGVSLIIAAVVSHWLLSTGFALVMLAVATYTSASRINARRCWPWVGLAIAAGAVPVLAVVFSSGAVPLTGISLVPIAGIIIGGSMTACSLTGRRTFAALRDEHNEYEAGISLGLLRSQAIAEVTDRHLAEALVPGLDQTRTVGLVTLPGAYVGVPLGGGSAIQAGSAQLLVLIGLLAAQTVTVAAVGKLVCHGRLLPTDLQASLIS